MEEPTNPDAPSSPAQPAEEIPDWVKGHLLEENPSPSEEGAGAGQPVAETLAEKHKAQRQNFHRLTTESDAALEGSQAAAEDFVEQDDTAPTGSQPEAPPQEPSLLDAFLLKAREFTQRVGQSARMLSQRLIRREQLVQPEQTAQQEQLVQQVETVQPEPTVQKGPPSRRMQNVWPRLRPFLWRGRIGPAFWTVASTLSLVVNIILIVILILLGRQLFFLKERVVSDQLINGLYDNFVLMDKAHIKTTITVSDTIQVKDTIPVVFDLPLAQKTVVTLTEDTPIKGATIYLNGQPVPLDLNLPPGTKLGIQLDLTVPVNQTVPVVLNVPVNLQVPVDIALDKTELHKPFVGLQQVLSPFRKLLGDVPGSWSEVCKGAMKLPCSVLRFK
jgi:hypothetical protein